MEKSNNLKVEELETRIEYLEFMVTKLIDSGVELEKRMEKELKK